ncbi:MAG: aminopeptidase [Eubacteriales bacterium]
MKTESTWSRYSKEELVRMEAFTKGYLSFLDQGKTERECVEVIVNRIEDEGYVSLEKLIRSKKPIVAGDKIYSVCMNKAITMFHMGTEDLEQGMAILGAHLDSPRLDVKQNPLYEENGLAYLDTHYYGGIKKYQWVTIPLAIHGVVILKDGTTVFVAIGEEESDPVFFISDLLIHLASEQMEKKANKVIEGEALDVIVGNRPIVIENTEESQEKKEQKDPVKQGVLAYLKETFDMEEEDFLSAELEVVPAGRAREAGFDRSMILAYGQDDRVCSYAALEAMLEVETPRRTLCCLLVDKEEIGSVGATGMKSQFFQNALAEIMELQGGFQEISLRRCLQHSCMLSSDVTSAYDPSFASSYDKKNVAYFGHGMVLNKFTGARGKSSSNDANAEYIARLRRILEQENVNFQTSELGRVDLGGGGTIAYILACYGMEVIDCGVAVMNMHAPHEATSKIDVYETKRGYVAFLTHI